MKINLAISCLLIATFSTGSQATVLYVRYNVNEIIIGTDSKRTAETGQTVCVCKILQVGDTVIASAGLAEYGAFDPRNFAREAINSSQSLVEARAKFEELISQPLIEVLQKLKAMGHDHIIEKMPGIFGGYQCIKFDAATKVYFGASERRKDGMAAGY